MRLNYPIHIHTSILAIAAAGDWPGAKPSPNQELMAQVQLDLVSLERAMGRSLSSSEQDSLQRIQERSHQNAFLIAGITSAIASSNAMNVTKRNFNAVDD
ncbi:MAG TPA: hypothetical protein V6D20_05195 [Candidatus Obscuribacterales bacterium]